MTSPFRQLALQAAAAILVLSLAWPYFGMRAEPMPWGWTALVIGLCAFAAAWLTRQPPWWRAIHLVFMPLAWAVSGLAIDPGWFLLAFILLLLVYRGAIAGQVPLFLSNAAAVAALEALLAASPQARFIDLGAGVGSTLIPLARRYPEAAFAGVENAPLTWLAGWLRTRGQVNVTWLWGDFWQSDLGQYDVVYAFLSPAPMAALWDKACREMKPGALLVSNSFPIPDVEPAEVIVGDEGARTLYCYRR